MTPIGALQIRNGYTPSLELSQLIHPTPTPRVFQGLSEFFPSNTAYFYSFPSGQDSSFFNGVPPWMEELVAARSLVCAGPNVKGVVFSPSMDPLTWDIMTQHFGVDLIEKSSAIRLSSAVTNDISGEERNRLVKESIASSITSGQLVQAQPFMDEHLQYLYQIPPRVTINLNDKFSREQYISEKYLPKILGTYANGQEFSQSTASIPFPSVIKVSSSSSGDGVRIAMDQTELEAIKKEFSDITTTIIIEQFIQSAHNVCVQFGIPADPMQPIQMLGYNEQVTTEHGGFLAGIVDPSKKISGMENVNKVLLTEILPKVRSMGWYGVGGIDVLIVDENEFYFIDSNFRMTATFTFIYLHQTHQVSHATASFAGSFRGSYDDFLSKIAPLGRKGHNDQLMSVIALTHRDGLFRFNAGILFDNAASLKSNAQRLLDLGVESSSLSTLVKTDRL